MAFVHIEWIQELQENQRRGGFALGRRVCFSEGF